MNYPFQMRSQHLESFQKNSKWFLMWGIALVFLGCIAISLSTFTTLVSVIILGMIFIACGAVILIDTFQFWWHKWSGFIPHFIIGLFYIIVGFMLVMGPIVGAVSLTLLLASLFIIIGLLRIIYSVSLQPPRWGWSFFNGIITLVLGILIMVQWPASGLFIIGLFVGIDLLLIGWTYIMVALFARRAS